MAKIPTTLGSGGANLAPHGAGQPSLVTILQDMCDDINVNAIADRAALATIATADATDQASTNALANAEKAKYNGELNTLANAVANYYGAANKVALLTQITTVDASGGTTAPGIALLNDLRARYNGELLTLMTSLVALTPGSAAANITAIATAIASDLTTSEALAIAIKGKYNGELMTLVNSLRTVISAFPTKTSRGA